MESNNKPNIPTKVQQIQYIMTNAYMLDYSSKDLLCSYIRAEIGDVAFMKSSKANTTEINFDVPEMTEEIVFYIYNIVNARRQYLNNKLD